MRRIVVEVPGLVGSPGEASVLREKLSALEVLAENGRPFKISPLPPLETPEALMLGMRPTESQMRQGPLTVSALGADPPDRSTHFHLSLMTYEDGVLQLPRYLPTAPELDQIWRVSQKLNTKLLTIVRGEGVDHGLVWEAFGDMSTIPAAQIAGKEMKPALPEGDGDRPLRMLIDDSINLLSDLELNSRRVDEGLPAFNIWWPWGHGVRQTVPNLILRRGEPAIVESNSLRLAGLTRLTGYRHHPRAEFGRGTSTKFAAIANRVLSRDISIVVFDVFRELREAQTATGDDRMDELAWLTREWNDKFLTPILNRMAEGTRRGEMTRLSLLGPGLGERDPGLGLVVDSVSGGQNSYPFDERSLEEKGLATFDFGSQVERGVLP